MQRLFPFRLFPAFLLPLAAAGNSLVVEHTAGDPGSAAEAVLRFVPSPEPVTALQFEIQYDTAALYIVSILGEAPRAAVKSVFAADTEGGKRFVIAGWNQNALPGGPLLRLLVHARGNAAAGTYGLRVTGVKLSHANGLAAEGSGQGADVAMEPAAGPRLEPSRLFNAAGMTTGAVAPGEIVTFFVPGLSPDTPATPVGTPTETELGGTRVFFDEIPAPLLYAGPGQINAIVPFGVDGKASAEVRVARSGIPAASMTVPVQAAAPAIFTLDNSGAGQTAVLNQDSTVNGPANPAARGSTIAIFATGGGQMSPAGRDGALGEGIEQRPALPVAVWVEGIAAEVSYAGAAPGLVAGALQINCKVPEPIEPGPALRIAVQVGDGEISPAGATIAVR